MTTTLEAIVARVKADFDTEQGPDHGIRFLIGQRFRDSREGVGTVIWVSTSGPIEPYPMGSAPITYVEDGQDYEADPFLQRVFDVEIDCWERTEEGAEILLRNLLRALNSALSFSGFTPQGWEDVSGQLGQNVKGSLLRLSCQLRTPILSNWEFPTPDIQSAVHTGSINDFPGCEPPSLPPPEDEEEDED